MIVHLVLLFNYLYIYFYKVKKYTSLINEVNPRHKVYYQEIFHFNQIGIERACPSVQNIFKIMAIKKERIFGIYRFILLELLSAVQFIWLGSQNGLQFFLNKNLHEGAHSKN